VKHQDAYKSIDEALFHAGSALLKKVEIVWIDSERNFQEEDIARELRGVQGILFPVVLALEVLKAKLQLPNMPEKTIFPIWVFAWECIQPLLNVPGIYAICKRRIALNLMN
jgi:CTP synthase